MSTGKGDFKFNITVDPSPIALGRMFADISEKFSDWKPFWHEITPRLLQGLKHNFDTRGASIDERWAKTNPNYLKRKIRKGFSRADMYLSGELVRQLTQGSFRKITATQLTLGVSLPYARAVNFGSKHGIKARKFMGWSDSMKKDLTDTMSMFAKEQLSRAAQLLMRAA